MVRLTHSTATINDKLYCEFAGLSTDEKPTANLLTGSIFIEVDTSKAYFFDEESESWLEAGIDHSEESSGTTTDEEPLSDTPISVNPE